MQEKLANFDWNTLTESKTIVSEFQSIQQSFQVEFKKIRQKNNSLYSKCESMNQWFKMISKICNHLKDEFNKSQD